MNRPETMTQQESHTHDYKEPRMFRIYNVRKEYEGTTGDRAFLYKACACGKGQVFEYGKYKEMDELLKRLIQ